MKVLLYLAIGLTIGSVSGAVGIGGGVLLVPALMWLYAPDNPRLAAGMTLAILAVPVTMPAVWQYYSQRIISIDDLKVAGCIAIAFAVGSFIGAAAQAYLPVSLLRLLLGLLIVYVAIRFIVNSNSESANAAAGLGAVAVAWAGYYCLRILGRRYLSRPDLGQQVRTAQEHGRGESDYQI